MKNLNKRTFWLLLILVISCLVMALVDAVIQPGYFVKSLIKLILFIGLPLVYCGKYKDNVLKKILKPKKKGLLFALILGILVYAVILIGYFITKDIFDYSNITAALENDVGVEKSNFIYVSSYISVINSFVEEFFFRGFIFFELLYLLGRKYAYIISSLSFSLYHVAIIISWGDTLFFVLMLIGLVVAAVIFNFRNEKDESIYTSWIVHMMANFSINTVGFILFGILS